MQTFHDMSVTLGNMTAQARRAMTLAPAFEAAARRVFTNYTVEMTRPEASTGGGVRARQRIKLVAADGSSLVVGWANVADGNAELHTLGHSLALSKQRYGRELVLPPIEYLRFLELATSILEDHALSVTVVAFTKAGVEANRDAKKSEPPPRRSATLPYYVADAVSTVTAFARRVLP